MTSELERWLRQREQNADVWPLVPPSTVAGIGPGGWDKHALANSQGDHTSAYKDKQTAESIGLFKPVKAGITKTVYRLYTEDTHRNVTIATIKRYFDGATLFYGIGLDARTQSTDEYAIVIEIVTSKPDAFQRILDLAGDLRLRNAQISVLITQQTVTTFEVTARTATHGEL